MRAVLPLLLLLAACPGPVREADGPDAGGPADAGGRPDAGSSAPDAGSSAPDAGSTAPDGGPADGRVEATFVVTVPAGTPRFDPICVAGSAAELDDWAACGLALTRAPDGRYSGTMRVAPGTGIQFKVTRGSWQTVEKAPDGSETANRTLVAQAGARAEVAVAAWADAPTITGNVESMGTFTSSHGGPRPVLVYLPPAYESEPSRRFPVLYMHDGQNLFDARTAFGGIEWGVDEAAERLTRDGLMAQVIVVAVGNTPDRIAEYTQTVDAEVGAGGGADAYARLLAEDLKPAVDARYRTLAGSETTGLAGSSLGGLVSMYLGLRRPETFRRIGVVSPSVWWDGRDIVARVQALAHKPPLRVWEDIGTAEADEETVADARALRDALVAKGWTEGDDLAYLEVPGARHNEAAWAARIDRILEFLYPP